MGCVTTLPSNLCRFIIRQNSVQQFTYEASRGELLWLFRRRESHSGVSST